MSRVAPAFPLAGILGVVFIVLKLCHVINWSWWWVTAPFWGGFAVAVTVALIFFLVYLGFKIFGNRNGNWWR